jgi:hypothetical protein
MGARPPIHWVLPRSGPFCIRRMGTCLPSWAGPYADNQHLTAYAFAYSGPFEVNEQASIVTHQVQVSAIPSWLGTMQIRQVQFRDPSTLVLSATERRAQSGVLTTSTITWSRQPPR